MIDTELNEKQRLLLWRLAVAGGEMWLSDIADGLKKAPNRKELIRQELISEAKQRRQRAGKKTTHQLVVTLEDRGWAWLSDHMERPIWKSISASEVLQNLLLQLQGYLSRNRLVLAELFASSSVLEHAEGEHAQTVDGKKQPAASGATANTPRERSPLPVSEQLVSAYARLAGNESFARVRLADLRGELASISREELDAALQQLVSDGAIILNRLDDPREITAADRDAMLHTVLGDPRHIMHMEIPAAANA